MGAETVTVPTVRRTTDTDTADGITDITINTAANLTATRVNNTLQAHLEAICYSCHISAEDFLIKFLIKILILKEVNFYERRVI